MVIVPGSRWTLRIKVGPSSLSLKNGANSFEAQGLLIASRALGYVGSNISKQWKRTGTRTSVSAGKRKLKMQSVGR